MVLRHRLAILTLFLFLFKSGSFGRISEEKCKEFGLKSGSKCRAAPLPLIVGGSDARPNEFPHMAMIGFGRDPVVWQCGGSLISLNFVLTAAHCSDDKELGPALAVKVGMSSRKNDTGVQQFKIKSIWVHPDWEPRTKYNDIALMELDHNVVIAPNVRPACLNSESIKEGSDNLTASGFGKTQFVADAGSDRLMKVDLPVLSKKECAPFFKNLRFSSLPKGLLDTQICAGVLTGGKDTCQGDSGGPLQIFRSEPQCAYSIVGVTSFGKFCGYARSPAIYTAVDKYLPWIEKTVWGWGVKGGDGKI